jgi:hypothetical protein
MDSRLRGNDKKGLFISVIRLAPCAIRDIRDPRVSFSFVSFLVAAAPRCVNLWLTGAFSSFASALRTWCSLWLKKVLTL